MRLTRDEYERAVQALRTLGRSLPGEVALTERASAFEGRPYVATHWTWVATPHDYLGALLDLGQTALALGAYLTVHPYESPSGHESVTVVIQVSRDLAVALAVDDAPEISGPARGAA